MKGIKILFFLIIMVLFMTDQALAAHILEPLGTEIAATPPRGRMFGQANYEYSRENDVRSHLMPVEFEIGLGERTQLNLEGEILLREEITDAPRERGVEEIGFGVKHRFLDETQRLPDAAFEAEFSPSVGLTGNAHALKGVLILSKNLHPRWVVHLNGGYELETESEGEEVVNRTTWSYNVAPMYRVVPDRLIVLAELNGLTRPSEGTRMTLAPEMIGVIQTETFFALQNLAFKLAVPIGLNDRSPDVGVRFGVSKLF